MLGQSLSARILAAVLLVAPLFAHAAGLGKLSVLSALGRPLNAEIEVLSIPRGDVESLTVRLASNEAFRQAGIDFNSALLSIRMAVERRGDAAVVKLTSTQPINEPFLDVLIELQWASGRLVREYTFLLDPPGYTGPQVIAASPAPAVTKPAAAPPAAESPAAPAAAQAPAVPPVSAPAMILSPPAAAPGPEAGAATAPSAAAQAEVEPAPAAAGETPVVAAAEPPIEPAATPVTPETRLEERPLTQEAVPPPAETGAPGAAAAPAQEEAASELTYEVKKGDTLSEIAHRHFVAGVTLNQMLIALYRENESAFIRDNVNLVREGKILTIPRREVIAAVDPDEARQLVLSHMADFGRYRSSLAAAAAQRRGDVAAVEQTSGGQIETRPEQTAPAGPKDQVKLSKADPAKPSSAASKAARDDDIAARERALQEAQSRVADLEKNVLDLRKLLELKNQQLAELEKRAAGKAAEPPRAAPAVPAVAAQAGQAPKPAAAVPAPAVGQPTAKPPAPAQKAPEPPRAAPVAPAGPAPAAPVAAGPPSGVAKAPEPIKPAAEAVQPPAAAKPAEAPKPKPAPKPAPPLAPAPTPSFIDEFLENPVALAGLGAVFVILLGYGGWAWRRKKAAQTRFQDSVLGPASTAGASSVFGPAQKAATGPSSVVMPSVSQASVGGMETDEVDPIAEADVYMAYGRDAQAEEILREALEKDASRPAIHEKLLEIYANRRDPKAFEQVALKLKEVTGGAGPDWDKAVALGRSIDPQNSLYGGMGRAAAPAPAAAAAASAVDFDLDASPAPAGAPDLLLGTAGEEPGGAAGSVDIDLGAPGPGFGEPGFTPEGTMIVESVESRAAAGGLDLDLGGAEESKPASDGIDFELPAVSPAPEPSSTTASADMGGGLDFDLQLDLGEIKAEAPAAAAGPLDLSSISLDLGGTPDTEATPASTDPKWQEVATKLDLAKAYEEMGDKNGASELLNEVLREGDGAQRSQAQELLAKLT